MPFTFTLHRTDDRARAGTWVTPHGAVETPAFMPVGTRGSVKGLTPDQLRSVGVTKILANTYHLAVRPGADVVADLGGLHRFAGWDGPMLTDSGGFQAFSLTGLRSLTEEGVAFTSHVDGAELFLSPERAVAIQQQLGADVMMCLDEVPALPAGRERLRAAVDRTTRWARRCVDAHDRGNRPRNDQALFGIVQGGCDEELRVRSAAGLIPLDFPGYAVGGLSVGEPPPEMYRTLEFTCPLLPEGKPRYLMGVGTPADLIEAVLRGIDLFDCVMPTRNARNGTVFTSAGKLRMKNASHARDDRPLDAACGCPTCVQFSRGYLRHLFVAGEMLAGTLLSLHNVAFYQSLMRDLRAAILDGRAGAFREERIASLT